MTDNRESVYVGNVLQNPKYKNIQLKTDELLSATNTELESSAYNDRMYRFQGNGANGYAAEMANNFADEMQGKTVVSAGDNNAKNGPDRVVDGQMIQTKYCQTARESVQAAFKNSKYKYIDVNDNPMQLEVPPEQYDEAVKLMRERIKNGQVPGTTDPDDVLKLVRKGSITYKQSVQVAKAGTVESLTFDAANGAVIATSSFGISATITFAKAMWDGEEPNKAIEMAMYSGLKMGGVAFATSVVGAQMTRTSLNKILLGHSQNVVKLLPSRVRKEMLTAMRGGAVRYGGNASKDLAKLLNSNVIAGGAFVLIMSAGDICDAFRGRISAKQLFKNVMTIVGGMGGATIGGIVGATVGSLVGVPTIGFYVGSVAGGMVGGSGTNTVMSNFIEDDAVEMLRIINDRLVVWAQEYLLSEDELEILLEDLNLVLAKEKLLLMFASQDRVKFADNMLVELIERIVHWRVRIFMPSDTEFIKGLDRVCEMCANGVDVEARLAKIKPNYVEVGKAVLGKEISKQATMKAMYVTRQMNLILKQNEMILQNMSAREKEFADRQQRFAIQINEYKAEVKKILEEYCYE